MPHKSSARNYFVNFSSQLSANILSLAISLFTTPYAARMLGPSRYGEFNLAASFAVYATLLSSFGFSLYASREVPRLDRIDSLVYVTTTLRFILGGLMAVGMFGIGYFLNISPEFVWVAVVAGVAIFVSALDLRWVFIAKERLAKVSYLGLIGQGIFAILLVFVVHSGGDLVKYAIIQSFVLVVPSVLAYALYRKEYGRIHLSLTYDKWRELRRESIPLGMTSLTATLNVYFAGLIIGLSISTQALGYYSAGFKLMMIFNVVFNLISTVMSPTISRLFVQDRKKLISFLQIYFLVCLSFGLASSVSIYVLSGWIVKVLFGPEYSSTIQLLKIWAAGLLPLTPLSIFFVSSLIACDGSKESAIAIGLGAVVSLTGVMLLVRSFGIVGAPVSQIVMEFTVAVAGGILLIRRLKLSRRELAVMFNIAEAVGRVLGNIRLMLQGA